MGKRTGNSPAGRVEALQARIAQLEGREAERAKAEAAILRVNRILKANRRINQLVASEADRNSLISRACEALTADQTFGCAWIALFDEAGKVAAFASSGIGDRGLELARRMQVGELPHCGHAVVEAPGVVTLVGHQQGCLFCSTDYNCDSLVTYCAALAHGRRAFGVVSVSVPRGDSLDSEEHQLVRDTVSDLALGLYRIDLERMRARDEARIRESEERFRLLYEHAPLAYQSLDEEGRIIAVNRAWLDTLGYRAEEVVGRSFTDFLTPDSAALFPERFAQFKRLGRISGAEFGLVAMDGSTVLASFEGSIGRDAAGSFVHTHCIFYNVTEHRRVEERRQESENRYRLLFNAMLDGFSLMEPVYDGARIVDARFLDVNPAIQRILGLPSESIVGRTVSEILPNADRGLLGRFEQVMATGEPQRFMHNARSLGRYFDMSIYRTGPRQLALLGLDVTDSHLALQALKASEERFTLFMDSIPAGVFIKDARGLPVYANRYMKEHFGADKWVDGLTYDYMPPDVAERARLDDARVIRDGAVFVEEVLPHLDGTMHNYEVTKFAIPRPGLDPLIGGIGVDVTRLKEAEAERGNLEEQLRQAQKMEAVGQLAGGVAHDFNNLLAAIMGYTELALESLCPTHKACADVRNILDAARRARDLTRQLLAFSRKQVLEMKVINLNAVVSGFSGILSRIIGENVELVLRLAENLGEVSADGTQIDQILMNLAANARDAMPNGGRLLIETANVDIDAEFAGTHPGVTPGPHVMLAVTDNGLGMDEETVSHVFEPFFTTKEFGKGTGLGLSTVYGIVKQHRGGIWVYSEQGRGTTMKIYLPRHEDGKASKEVETAAACATAHAPARVLLVEDNAMVRQLAARILRLRGYDVTEAAGPDEALAAVSDEDAFFDLLVTDIVMPRMNGRELHSSILRSRPGLPVLFMSGYTESAIDEGILDPGMHFIQKPFSVDTFADKVAETLGS